MAAQNRISRRTFVERSSALAALSFAGESLASAAEPTAQSGAIPIAVVAAENSPRPFLTPADEFYTVARGNPKPHTLEGDALAAARMTPETWRLEITADPFVEPKVVAEPATIEKALTLADGTALTFAALHKLAVGREVRFVKAIQCLNIATPLGQGLWEGVSLRDVLRLCGKLHNVRRIYFRGFHNNDPKQIFQSSVSYSQAMETPPEEFPVFLATKLNGEPIPPVRGGPVRMIVPWAHGFKNIKWLQQIFVTNDYRANDTYALANNDPESPLKTAAYIDEGPEKIAAGDTLRASGQVICGRSGLKRVEYWLREAVSTDEGPLADDAPELLNAEWTPCRLLPPPDDWKTALPPDVKPSEILGFDERGRPRTWPLRYGMATWTATIAGLKPGRYELRARAVDLNDFAQPEPRPQQKSGKNAIPVRRVEVLSEGDGSQ